jgi:hypothetical protein
MATADISNAILTSPRGQVDLAITASFWIGAALGSVAALLLLNTTWIPPVVAWRFAFGVGRRRW